MMIIEDEKIIEMDIEKMVERIGNEVVGIERKKDEEMEIYEKEKKRMVIEDIKIEEGR